MGGVSGGRGRAGGEGGSYVRTQSNERTRVAIAIPAIVPTPRHPPCVLFFYFGVRKPRGENAATCVLGDTARGLQRLAKARMARALPADLPGDMLNVIADFTLYPRPLCRASRELGAELSPQTLEWMRSEYPAAAALAHQAGMTFDDLCQALTARMTAPEPDHMQLLGKLSSLLRRLEELSLLGIGQLGMEQLAAGLGPDAMPRLLRLCLRSDPVPNTGVWPLRDAGVSSLADAVNQGALRGLEELGE